jgi:hypothetical protein
LAPWPRAGYATPKATGWILPNMAGRSEKEWPWLPTSVGR